MRKLHVRHEPLPYIGEKFELETASGVTVTVIAHRSGRRDLAIGEPRADDPLATLALTRPEAAAVAALLVGAHIELVTTPDP